MCPIGPFASIDTVVTVNFIVSINAIDPVYTVNSIYAVNSVYTAESVAGVNAGAEGDVLIIVVIVCEFADDEADANDGMRQVHLVF